MNAGRISQPNAFLDYRPGSGNTVEILDIAVDGTHRRQGLGRWMVNKLLERVDDGVLVFAITRDTNYIAQQFYEDMRFKIVGFLRDFYADGESALMYGRRKGSQA